MLTAFSKSAFIILGSFFKIINKLVFQISDKWAVTASHCLKSINKEDFSLVIGVHDRAVVEDILVTDTGESAGHW